jgi:hypothetical protein
MAVIFLSAIPAIILILTGPILFYVASKYIAEHLFKKQYSGNYAIQSAIIYLLSIFCIILFYVASYTAVYEKNGGVFYGDYTYYDYFMFTLDLSWYSYIIIPSITIVLFLEFVIRTLIFKNNILFAIFNTLFFLIPLSIVAYVIENIRIGF